MTISCDGHAFFVEEQCYQWRMVEYGGRPKFHGINTPLWPMALPWRAALHKLPMAVGPSAI